MGRAYRAALRRLRRWRKRVEALNAASVAFSVTDPLRGSMPICRAKEAPS
jgi:hypothetical protein